MTYDGRGLFFGTVAEQYDAHRPSPPPDAATVLGDVRGLDVLEVAAGTGLWTRFLLELGARVTIVEPDDDMRAVLLAQSPHVTALRGTAEALPVADASFDAVLVSSAWHWFEQPSATNEMARVLRDGGALYVLWNGFDRDVAWMADLVSLRERPDDDKRPSGWTTELPSGGEFDEARRVRLGWTRTLEVEQLVSLFATFSGAIMKSDEERREMNRELRARLVDHSHDGVVDVPMALHGAVVRRRARL